MYSKPKRITCNHMGTFNKCEYRASEANVVGGDFLDCKCGGVTLYHCDLFNEDVTLSPIKKDWSKLLRANQYIKGVTIDYRGRACEGCHRTTALPLTDNAIPLTQLSGIVTGANEKHWPCLGALAIYAAENEIGFAVADHGLRDFQRNELDRIGVQWIKHDYPDLSCVKNNHKISSEIKAWWKPWVCLSSPFDRSLWIDSDAVAVGDVTDILRVGKMQISTQDLWTEQGPNIYRKLVSLVFGDNAIATLESIPSINSGVFAWTRGEPIIELWSRWCQAMINSPDHISVCRVRDQAGLMLALLDMKMNDIAMPEFLPDEYNVPADYLPAGKSKYRKPVPLDPYKLLNTTRSRHSDAIVVHWLGGVKPWTI